MEDLATPLDDAFDLQPPAAGRETLQGGALPASFFFDPPVRPRGPTAADPESDGPAGVADFIDDSDIAGPFGVWVCGVRVTRARAARTAALAVASTPLLLAIIMVYAVKGEAARCGFEDIEATKKEVAMSTFERDERRKEGTHSRIWPGK